MRILLAFISIAVFSPSGHSAVKPAGVFTDGMVLQRDAPVRVWGVADAGEVVAVEFAEQRVSARADAEGDWMILLEPIPVSATPREMVFSSQGRKQIVLEDVVVGEVWLAGGQSNMAGTMQGYRETVQSDIVSANDPLLRMVTIPRLGYEGQNSARPTWKATTPQNVKGFSASAYYFAKNLRERLGVPVGIVSCSVGGTPAEAWMSRETLSSTPSLKRVLDAYDSNVQEKYSDFGEYLRLAEERELNFSSWNEKRIAGVKPLPRYPVEVMGPHNYKRPSGLHETMLTQTIPYTLRGVIWYQGENNANAGAGFHYRTVFPALIDEWRSEFMNPRMPFLFVQIAPFGPANDATPKWPELRDAQLWTEDNVENTGMVVLADGGELDDIHPHSKEKVGLRLSLLARNMVYGEKELICRGPRVEKVIREDDWIALEFSNSGSGLVLESVAATPFEICGKDGVYVPAEATLVDGKLIVSAEGVGDPQYVRYGWRKWFEPTLFNKVGLPASPFKTDDFEPESKGRHFLDDL